MLERLVKHILHNVAPKGERDGLKSDMIEKISSRASVTEEGSETKYVESVNIYVLIDPRTNEIRYVGKTVQSLFGRLASHRHTARNGGASHRDHWIAQVLRCGYDVRIELIQIVVSDFWEDAERYWISYYRSVGCSLTNMTDGGDSGPTMPGELNPFYGRTHSEETRDAIRQARTGTKASSETRAKLSAIHKANPNKGTFKPGHIWSDESRAKRSESQKGVLHTPEEKAKISAALKGWRPVKAQCQRWNINRDKPCICGQHQITD